jgi:glutathione S-transferase
MKMKLYIDPSSTVCRGLMLFVADSNIEVELAYVNLMQGEQLAPNFVAINPNHTVPVLVDGDLTLTESSAILKYLADLTGSCAYPAELRERARVNQAMDWFNTGFYARYGYQWVYPQVLPYLGLQSAAGQSEMIAMGKAAALEKLAVLDRHMIGDNDYVCGPRVTIADYFGLSIVALGELIDVDLGPFPNVRRWLAAMKSRPAWPAIDVAFQGWRSALKAQAA